MGSFYALLQMRFVGGGAFPKARASGMASQAHLHSSLAMHELSQTIFSPRLPKLTNNHENKFKGVSRSRPSWYKVRPIPRDFFDPTPEQQNVVLIDTATLQKAQRLINGCEACSEDAEIPLNNISRSVRRV